MLGRLGRVVIARRRLVLVLAVVFVALAAGVGGGVVTRLKTEGFADPAAESSRAFDVLGARFGGSPNLVLVAHAPGGVDGPAAVAAGAALTARAANDPRLRAVGSYWSLGRPSALRSRDGTAALLLAHYSGADSGVVALERDYAGSQGGLSVEFGGQVASFREIGSRIQSDLAKAEAIAIPITLVLLVLVFGSVVAALLPLAVAGVAVVGTFLVLQGLTGLTDVSIYALNLVTAMGLGLAIDYALFVVSRYREELRRGREPREAVLETVRTAGRTVVVSASTVALSLGALLVFPLYFLRSFAYAGIAVVLLAAAGAVVVLPALLAVLGRNVDRWRVLRRPSPEEGSGFWHRTAELVMRRPGPIAAGVVLLLLALGAPFLGASFGLPDDRVLPRDAPSHVVAQELRTQFPSREADSAPVILPRTAATDPAVGDYAARLSALPGVDRVDAASGSYARGARVLPPGPGSARFRSPGYSGTYVSVVSSVEPRSDAGQSLARSVRAVPAPGERLVAGNAAFLLDTEHAIGHRLPLAVAIIVVATLLVLFLFTGSVLIPVKAIVLNLLSLTATFGAMVYVFQEGHLQALFGHFQVTHTLDTSMPVLLFCIAFGLSMDYEVFLLSRIREEWLATGDNRRAVALGLERTGRLVTAAAALISVVFIATATSGITFIRLFGTGMALAVIVDATLIRGALVPAFMRLAGRWNWWAPGPLRRLHDRVGLRDEPQPLPAGAGPTVPAQASPAARTPA